MYKRQTNCCILGVAILVIQKDFDLLTGVVYALSLIHILAYALKALKPSVKVYGVQALGAASMANSILLSLIHISPNTNRKVNPVTGAIHKGKRYFDAIILRPPNAWETTMLRFASTSLFILHAIITWVCFL